MTNAVQVEALRAYVCDTGFGRSYVFVVVDTTAGVSGYGEASQSDQDAAVLANVEQLASSYVGHNVFELIERRSALYRSGRSGRAMVVAASGIEIALWDAIGKLLGTPVYRLLGGSCTDSLRCYATIFAGVDDWSDDGLATEARAAVDNGYSAVKIVPFVSETGAQVETVGRRDIDRGRRRVEAVRQVVGDDIDIMIECRYGLDPVTASQAAAELAAFGCFWMESPLAWDEPAELVRVGRATGMRIASGELTGGLQNFRGLIENRAVDVLQPDVKWVGGIQEAKKIAAWAESYQIDIAPHNNSGPVATAASAHLLATLRNGLILEVAARQPAWERDLLGGSNLVRHGTVDLADLAARPGLGVAIDETVLADTAVATASSS